MTVFNRPAIDPVLVSEAMVQQVHALLDEIERERGLRVLFACESGSRAWGFASNDSDYDVRFIYAYPLGQYLRLRSPVDAFDRQAPHDIDAGGWDIRKAAELMRRSNPPLMEWIDSPIVYRADPTVLAKLRGLRAIYFDAKKAVFHYLSMASQVWTGYLSGQPTPVRKKYLYALRPLACVRYIEQHRKQPPTRFEDVLARIDWPVAVMAQVRDLVARKKANTELGAGNADEVLNAHIAASLVEGQRVGENLPPNDQPNDALDLFIAQVLVGS